MAADCIDEYHRNNIFFKKNSAIFWRNSGAGSRTQLNGGWTVTQREGFPLTCLLGDGRFYFTYFASNVVNVDIGLCLPASCSQTQLFHDIIPKMYEALVYGDDFQYGVQLREYRPVTLDALSEAPPFAVLCIGVVVMLASFGFRASGGIASAALAWPQTMGDCDVPIVLADSAAEPAGDVAAISTSCHLRSDNGGGGGAEQYSHGVGDRRADSVLSAEILASLATTKTSEGKTTTDKAKKASGEPALWSPLHTLVTAGLIAGELMQYTRWNAYKWHQTNSRLFTSALAIGAAARRGLPAVQMLRFSDDALEAEEGACAWRRLWHSIIASSWRLASLCMLSLFWVAVSQLLHPLLTFNIFSKDPWIREWPASMVACSEAPTWAALFAAGPMTGLRMAVLALERASPPPAKPCLHLESVRSEMRLLPAAIPLVAVAAMIGRRAAAGVAFAASLSLALAPRFHLEQPLPWWAPTAEDVALVGTSILATGTVRSASSHGTFRRAACFAEVVIVAIVLLYLSTVGSENVGQNLARAALDPLALACVWMLLNCVPVARPLASLLRLLPESAAEGAVPAIPLVLFVLEGHLEPHAKWLTLYDFSVRWAGLLGVCTLIGAVTASSLRGAAVATSTLAEIARWIFPGSLRITLEDSSGHTRYSCRLPMLVFCSVVVSFTASVAAAALRLNVAGPPWQPYGT
eukprot:TRINITY_DN14040_c0_g1_i1.p1 TRINITY_DN14040_c0_g1~~TRINITY_DN14040_c0_g1_i1.p1  ORF type:complete len:692 (-),score=85.71 TRINITY_DN14040_c0_g1_i1:86-2161(-)